MQEDDVYIIPGWVYSCANSDTVHILNIRTDRFFALDGSAVEIWRCLQAGMQVKQIVENICRQFNIEKDTAERDVLVFLEELLNRNLIVKKDNNSRADRK